MKVVRRFSLIIPVFLAIAIGLSCSKKPQALVEVSLANLEVKTKVSLNIKEFKTNHLVGSFEITPQKPTVQFKLYNISEPTIVQILTDGKKNIETLLIVEPGETVRLQIDLNQPGQYVVSGSNESLLVKELNDRLLLTRKSLDSLGRLISASKDRGALNALNRQVEAVIDSQRVFSSRFVWRHPMSRASVVALYQQIAPEKYVLDRAEDLQLFKVVASSLIARYPGSTYAQGMTDDINEMTRRLKSQQVLSLIRDSKPTLPDIVLPNTKGDTVRLSSQMGRVIVLNFWASWNAGSMLATQELTRLSNQLKGKPLVVFNVSLDTNREAWVKAIEQAGFQGIHVCELNTAGSVAAGSYNVSSLPANFVIDKNYDIIGRDVYGESLVRMVNELLR